jgi:aminopeptidase
MLWKQILQSSRADGENPLADWDAHLLELKKRRDWMTSQHFTSLHYTSGQGTDLTIGLSEKHIWQGGAEETTSHILFNANIPTEEIYTAPDASRVNGIVYSTRPLVYNGNLIDNFHITFKDGHAIESKAETGDDVLKQILSMDEGASRLGEVALIPYHSPISLSHILFYETLFDENASCHLAFGKAYPTCLSGGSGMDDQELRAHGLNDSMIHVDFMVGSDDLSIMGTKADGTTVPVFINGDWA